jgi:hypothetical protein
MMDAFKGKVMGADGMERISANIKSKEKVMPVTEIGEPDHIMLKEFKGGFGGFDMLTKDFGGVPQMNKMKMFGIGDNKGSGFNMNGFGFSDKKSKGSNMKMFGIDNVKPGQFIRVEEKLDIFGIAPIQPIKPGKVMGFKDKMGMLGIGKAEKKGKKQHDILSHYTFENPASDMGAHQKLMELTGNFSQGNVLKHIMSDKFSRNDEVDEENYITEAENKEAASKYAREIAASEEQNQSSTTESNLQTIERMRKFRGENKKGFDMQEEFAKLNRANQGMEGYGEDTAFQKFVGGAKRGFANVGKGVKEYAESRVYGTKMSDTQEKLEDAIRKKDTERVAKLQKSLMTQNLELSQAMKDPEKREAFYKGQRVSKYAGPKELLYRGRDALADYQAKKEAARDVYREKLINPGKDKYGFPKLRKDYLGYLIYQAQLAKGKKHAVAKLPMIGQVPYGAISAAVSPIGGFGGPVRNMYQRPTEMGSDVMGIAYGGSSGRGLSMMSSGVAQGGPMDKINQFIGFGGGMGGGTEAAKYPDQDIFKMRQETTSYIPAESAPQSKTVAYTPQPGVVAREGVQFSPFSRRMVTYIRGQYRKFAKQPGYQQ